MAFVKKNWLYIVLGVVAVGSLATAGWAYMAGDAIIEQLQSIERVKGEVQREAGSAPNAAVIEAKKEEQARLIAEQERVLQSALSPQLYNAFERRDRQPLVPGVLPNPESRAKQIEFKNAYRTAFNELRRRLNARGPATPEEVAREQAIDDSKRAGSSDIDRGPWMPKGTTEEDSAPDSDASKTASLADLLRQYPKARATENVARSIYMYLRDGALAPHPMLENQDVPNVTEIWHAQMTLWIQQDIAFALMRLNEKRAEELRAAGRPYDAWVANMPVKQLKQLASAPWLGRGGGMNRAPFATSFTNVTNDGTKFVVPLFLQVVIEESALLDLLDSICRVGYYTPTRVATQRIEHSLMQDEFIYGEAPVIEVSIDIEAVYFRKVFDAWIPTELGPILARPEAKEDPNAPRR